MLSWQYFLLIVCRNTENLSEKQTIGFGKFNASNIPLILHCIVQINPSFL